MVVKKSQDAKTQLYVWSKLLEARLALQKVVTATRQLEIEEQQQAANESTVKSVNKLLTSLVVLRDTYRKKSQFCRPQDETSGDQDLENYYSQVDDNFLQKKHDQYNGIRDDIIEKWCEKTKIGTIPKKGYVALELPTLQLIKNSLKDKERLIRRTQLDRTSQVDDAYDPETFNDDDFYHHLLKEVISKEDNRHWAELQRIKYKHKRKANVKATKGRQIKKDLVTKLINFMAPTRPANARHKEVVPDQIRNELIKSLFGGSVR